MEEALVFAYRVPYISHTRYIHVHMFDGELRIVFRYICHNHTQLSVDSCVAERFKVASSLQATTILESATTDNKEIDNLYSMKAQNSIRPLISITRRNGTRVRARLSISGAIATRD